MSSHCFKGVRIRRPTRAPNWIYKHHTCRQLSPLIMVLCSLLFSVFVGQSKTMTITSNNKEEYRNQKQTTHKAFVFIYLIAYIIRIILNVKQILKHKQIVCIPGMRGKIKTMHECKYKILQHVK